MGKRSNSAKRNRDKNTSSSEWEVQKEVAGEHQDIVSESDRQEASQTLTPDGLSSAEPSKRASTREAAQDSPAASAGFRQSTAATTAVDRPVSRPARRWRRRLLAATLGLAAAVAAAPQLVQVGPVRNWLLARATTGLPVAVQLESLRVNWWSPVEVRGLEISADGASLARVRSIRSEAAVWQLAWSPMRLGTWTIEGAELDVTLRPGGSNWEDLVARLPASEASGESASGSLPCVAVAVREATVRIATADTAGTLDSAQTVVLENTQADLALNQPLTDAASTEASNRSDPSPAAAVAAVSFSASGQVRGAAPDASRPHWQLTGDLQPAGAVSAETQLRGTLQLASLPLPVINPLATRLGFALQADGAVDGSVDGRLVMADAQESTWRLEPSHADLIVQGLAVRSSLWHDETIASERVRLNAECAVDGSTLSVSRGELATDWLEANVSGAVDLTRMAASGSITQLAARWPEACRDLATRGTVQFAPLATQLPKTLGLRDGLAWKSGQAAWEMQQESLEGGTRFLGKLSIDGLTAEQGTERYALSDPVQAEFRWSQRAGQGQMEQLSVKSAFLTLQGQGDLRQGQLQGRADLGRLAREVRQFVELGDQQGAGQIEAQLNWQEAGDGAWRATARGVGSQLQWTAGGVELWSEKTLNLDAGLQARLEDAAITVIESGELHVVAGQDRLDAVLQQPARGPWSDARVSLEAKLSGQLAHWQNRLRPFVAWQDWQLRGELQSQAVLTVSPQRLEIQGGQLQLRQAVVANAEQQWHEPALQLQLQGSYDLERGQLDCPQLTLASTSVSLKADQLAWPPLAGREAMQVQYRGDLARLWQHVGPQAAGRPRGQLAGRLQLVPSAGQWTVRSATRVQDFQWETLEPPAAASSGTRAGTRPEAAKTQLVWQEPVVDLNVDGQWLEAEQSVRLQRATLVTSAAQLQVQGDLQQLAGPLQVRLQGSTRFDLDQLTARLQPLYGDQIRLTGAVDRPFALEGPLRMVDTNVSSVPTLAPTPAVAANTSTRLVSRTPGVSPNLTALPAMNAWVSPELKGEAGVGWQSAHAFGFDLSAAAIDARLQQQMVAIQPLDLQLSGGKLHLEPRLQLQGTPLLELAPGRVLDQVTITPAMCQGWLKFVAPLVADAAVAEGRFSAELRQMSLPLLDPDSGRVQAVLGIHAARIGPGPLAAELLSLVGQVRAVLDGQPLGAAPQQRAQDAWVTFPEQQVPVRMENGRVAHEGLTMLLGDIPVKTQGWVGMDNQLSLVAEIPIQESWLRDERWLAGLKGQTLRIPVRGTIQRPQLDRSILQQLGQTAVRGAAQGLLQDEVQRQMNKLLPDLLQRAAPKN
jgi:hypothetical protein